MASIEERLKQIDKALDDYEGGLTLPPAVPPGTEEELNEYLNMDRSVLKSLDRADCSEICYRLAQYSLYIQRISNKEQSRVTWADAVIQELTAPAVYEALMTTLPPDLTAF